MNSRQKGKRGEREFAAVLREFGFDARRGQQFSGGPGSPDVVGLPGWHIEVKLTNALRLRDACTQAAGDCGTRPWIVAHRWNHGPWLVIVKAEDFLRLVSESLPPNAAQAAADPQAAPSDGPSPTGPR